jgi:hypothetical protein
LDRDGDRACHLHLAAFAFGRGTVSAGGIAGVTAFVSQR